MRTKTANHLRLPDIVGKGYGTFWRFKGRYRVCKGSRASKKSKTTALNNITRLMEYPQANLLCVRKTYRTLKDSCFTELKWAIHRLGVDAWWDIKESPLEMTYKPTGQKILFRGLDDPLKVTSITVEVGVLCWLWIEEAYEISSEADFDTLDESIRGDLDRDLHLKIAQISANPLILSVLNASAQLTENMITGIRSHFMQKNDDSPEIDSQHTRLVHAITEKDAPLAEKIMNEHMHTIERLLNEITDTIFAE